MFSRAKLFIVSYFLLLNSMFTLIKSYSVLFNKCSEGEAYDIYGFFADLQWSFIICAASTYISGT